MSQDTKQPAATAEDKFLFWACFIALIATAFGFVIRAMVIEGGVWATEFGLSETENGQIFGAGLWPFAISIVLFSLILDRIGYRAAMYFALICHIASAIITITATGYWSLYIGTFICALGNGTVEAVINPAIATAFKREKTKWLNMLHAGWPGGMLVGGLLALTLGFAGITSWKVQIGLILIPTFIYGFMMLRVKFPINERVTAGVSYIDMLKEVGGFGALIAGGLVTIEVCRVIAGVGGVTVPLSIQIAIVAVIAGGYGFYVKSLGRPLFIFLLLVMMPLATTELGTDSWITKLMKTPMENLGLPAVSVLLWTSFVMMVLRFVAGPIVHALSPLGLLACSSVIAAVGLAALSRAEGIMILGAATLYAFGKTFFWPTMLGVVAERFPRGGAMTLNTIAGVGMLSVGIIGAPFLGNIQDKFVDSHLATSQPALHATYVLPEVKESIFGNYKPLDAAKVETAPKADKAQIDAVVDAARKEALFTVAIFPCIMLICYLALIAYFKSKGGYKAVHLDEGAH